MLTMNMKVFTRYCIRVEPRPRSLSVSASVRSKALQTVCTRSRMRAEQFVPTGIGTLLRFDEFSWASCLDGALSQFNRKEAFQVVV